MNTPRTIGRRHFLLGAGGAALVIPTLSSLFGREAAAGEPARPRNFVSWRIANGFYGQQWYPSAANSAALQVVEPNVRELALTDIQGPVSEILDARFDPFRAKSNLLRHIDRLDWGDHNAASGLLGWSDSAASLAGIDVAGLAPSIDQIMATRLGAGLWVPLNLTVHWSAEGRSPSCSTTPQGALVFEPGLFPEQAFATLFTGFDADATVVARLRAQRLTMVDRVLEHYGALRNHPRLSTADRDALDQHIEHMHTLELQLANPIDCGPPTQPGVYDWTPEAVNAAAQSQVDIAVAALRCGLTHVVNFYLDPDTLLNEALHGVIGGHHGASHDSSAAAVQSILNAHRWSTGYLFDFLAKLDETPNLDGTTLLDDSLVLFNNEIGNQSGASGGDSPGDFDNNHIGVDCQVLLVGSCGGALRTGSYLDYRTDFTRSRWSQYIGTAYNRVLVTCMLAMGLEPDDWEVGGTPGYGDRRGAQYDMTPLDQVVIGDLRAMLPRLGA
ncbi:MAG: DUF1552 domain-containing protein [Deltaproteobacteria bacterium]|nr:DUF1552 domain-containing protein [Deltaproteobacteria bacterium]MBK8713718.1 DUF1552 domain-containing protein [Deltaproteobacteria bacterium]